MTFIHFLLVRPLILPSVIVDSDAVSLRQRVLDEIGRSFTTPGCFDKSLLHQYCKVTGTRRIMVVGKG